MSFPGLDQKVAVVTGGASGIGEAAVRRLSAEGARVVVLDRNLEAAVAVVDSLPNPAMAVQCDVAIEADVQAATAAAIDRFGQIDLHFLNAGIPGSVASFEDLEVDEFDQVLAVNLRGTFLGLREAFRQYAKQETGGSIVITASICSFGGSDDLVAYHATKHGLVGLMQSAAIHGAPLGVRVNAVAPGIVPTGLLQQAADPQAAIIDLEKRAKIAPMRRSGTPDEVADLVAFMLSGEAAFMTGETILIDGGANALNPVRWSGQGGKP